MPAALARPSRTALAALLLFALVAAAYWPGLHGGFLFDDYTNLDALGRYGGVRDFNTLVYYLSSGLGDPTGRPLSQLSFLLDARDWPADPWPFKRTNLLLHLLNGVLLLALLLRLERWLPVAGGERPARDWTPLLAATLWLAHPLWVSTTLYIVQREAMLAATFVLLGLLAWDTAYRRLRDGANLRGWLWLALGTGGATVCAGLCKANGFLLPLLALVLWWTLQARGEDGLSPPRRRALHWQVALGIGVPALAITGYVLAQAPSAIRRAAAMRDWTLGERLLSQPRALFDYLGLLVAPREGSGGVFNDGFAASHGLFDPATTLPALLGIVALVALGFAAHKRWPRLAAALLFFLAGHLMESGPVPLELYFEHRNYLPALLLGWPLAHALLAPGRAPRARRMLALALPLLWLALTWQRALVWGNPPLQAALWAERNPESPRSQGYYADILVQQGRTAEARALLAHAEARMPGQVEIALNSVAEACTSGKLDASSLVAAEQAIRLLRRWNQGTMQWFDRLDQVVLHGDCPALGNTGLERLLAAAEANPAMVRSASRRQAMLRLRARGALVAGDAPRALQLYNVGLDLDPKPQTALAQAADLGNAGYPALGVLHLDHYAALDVQYAPRRIQSMADVHRWLLLRTGYYRNELDSLRQRLQEAAAGEPPTPSGNTGAIDDPITPQPAPHA